MIHAHFGIVDGCGNLDFGAQAFARALGTGSNDVAHEVQHVGIGRTQPVLEREEIGAQVLRGAGDEAQELRQAPQHLHLRCATGGLLFLAAAEFLEQGHGTAGRLAHVEVAQARQLDHFGRRGHADHGVAVIATRLQVVDDGEEMALQEQHPGHDDVGLGDVRLDPRQQGIVAGVFRRRVQVEGQAGEIVLQGSAPALERTREMGIHGDDADIDRHMAARGHRAGDVGIAFHTPPLPPPISVPILA